MGIKHGIVGAKSSADSPTTENYHFANLTCKGLSTCSQTTTDKCHLLDLLSRAAQAEVDALQRQQRRSLPVIAVPAASGTPASEGGSCSTPVANADSAAVTRVSMTRVPPLRVKIAHQVDLHDILGLGLLPVPQRWKNSAPLTAVVRRHNGKEWRCIGNTPQNIILSGCTCGLRKCNNSQLGSHTCPEAFLSRFAIES